MGQEEEEEREGWVAGGGGGGTFTLRASLSGTFLSAWGCSVVPHPSVLLTGGGGGGGGGRVH